MTVDSDDTPLTATAIVGMACRFPGSRTLDAFWENLRRGRSHVRAFEDGELRAAGISDATMTAPNYVKAGAPLGEIEWFDHGFFGLSAEEAMLLDPQHRIFLECAWEALEDGGYAATAERPMIGIFGGSAMSSYAFKLLSKSDVLRRFGEDAIRHANDKDYLTALAAYLLDLRGPAVTVQSGCATGLLAVHLACQSLAAGECDMALAGAVSIRVPEYAGYSYVEGSILSPEGRCRPFAADASGTVYGNGAGIVLLKPLETALAERDNIHAVIIGSAVNNSGGGRTALTAPSAEGQRRAIREALALARVRPADIDYIEAHGSGTLLGDAIELEVLGSVFGDAPCAIGAVKGNIGHTGVAAGMAGLIKTVLCLEHRALAPSLGGRKPNPLLGSAGPAFEIVTNPRPWPRARGPRRAGVSAFGMTGSNAHLVLQEAPPVSHRQAALSHFPRLVTLSAPSEQALRRLAGDVGERLARAPCPCLEDVAYTLQVGRRPLSYRIAEVFASGAEASAALAPSAVARLRFTHADASPRAPLLVFPDPRIFGPDDGRGLYRWHPEFRAAVDAFYRAAESADADLDGDWNVDCASAARQPSASARLLRALALQLGLARVWHAVGVVPSARIGIGSGSIAAACAAGVISTCDAARLAVASPASPVPHPAIGKAMISEHRAVLFPKGDGGPTSIDDLHLVEHDLALVLGPRQDARPREIFSFARGGEPTAEVANLLRAVGAVWCAGHDLAWDALYPGEEPRRASLPTTPFDRQWSWFAPPDSSPLIEDEAVPMVAVSSERIPDGANDPPRTWS